jgi:glycosyltransferase involved in cell wall biosynthesis
MKKNILIFVDWFQPAYKAGGPIQSVTNIIHNLSLYFQFWIVTSNTDLGEVLDLKKEDLNTWLYKEKFNIIYLDKENQSKKKFKQILNENDYASVYINSLFSFRFSTLPLLSLKSFTGKIVIAPRGMLGKGALNIKKNKKKIFLSVFKILKLHRGLVWHATDISEKEEIIENFGNKTNIFLVPNLPKFMKGVFERKEKEPNNLKIFFLSRISEKKNLIGAIRLLQKVKKSCKIIFDIIGPIDNEEYWKDCKIEIEKLSDNIKLRYLGAIPNYSISDILKHQHLLFLPTFHENYGHVIMESWQASCPVIISNNTPWKELNVKKIGYNIDLSREKDFIEAINYFIETNKKEYNEWAKCSYNFAKEISNDQNLIKNTIELLK